MKNNNEGIVRFTQLYVNLLNKSKKENKTIKELVLSSSVEQYFGRYYLRFYVGLPDYNDKNFFYRILNEDGSYLSYLIRNKNSDIDDFWVKYFKDTINEYEKDVQYFVSVIKAIFPDIGFSNRLKQYNIPYNINYSHWYDDSDGLSVSFVVNNPDVKDINDYVSVNYYGEANDLNSPYKARIEPFDLIIENKTI